MAAPSVADRLKAGQGKKRDFKEVDVVIDADVSEQVDALEDRIEGLESEVSDLEAEKERITPDLRFSDPRGKDIDDKITAIQETIAEVEAERDALRAGTLVTLRFDKLGGDTWSQIAAKYPARIDVAIDRISGYNYQATAREAAPLCGYVVGEDDAREDLDAEAWGALFDQISGRETENIAASLWELNDWHPRKKIEAAKKGSSVGSGSRSN